VSIRDNGPEQALRVRLRSTRVGAVGPGLASWDAAAPILRGAVAYQPAPVPKPAVERVPARERRRTTFTIALALAAAEQALGAFEQGVPLPTVFACSGGDTEIIDRICRALLEPGRPVSPADFHHSVHNAPAGYWSIACHDRAPTVSLSAYDASFAAGLIEGATQLASGAGRVLLVAYDTPAPAPIWRFRPLLAPFATALVLESTGVPDDGGGGLELTLDLVDRAPETMMADPELEALRRGNPAARALPLLELVARGRPGEIALPYLHGRALRLRCGAGSREA
jgi:hypothetical protein